MFYVCAARFYVTENLKKFIIFLEVNKAKVFFFCLLLHATRKFSSSVAKVLALAICNASQAVNSLLQALMVPKYRGGMAEIEVLSALEHTRVLARGRFSHLFSFEAKQVLPNGMAIHQKISALHSHIYPQTLHDTGPDSRYQDIFFFGPV